MKQLLKRNKVFGGVQPQPGPGFTIRARAGGGASVSLGADPNFAYHGGPVILNARIHACFWGSLWSDQAHQTRSSRLVQFLTDLSSSPFMNVLSQYGVGQGSFADSSSLGTVAATLADSDIQTILQQQIDLGNIPAPGSPNNDVYLVFLDENIGVKDANTTMCEASGDNAFGYHFFFKTTAGAMCYYAVIPGLDDTCVKNSCPLGDSACSLQLTETQEQRLTQVSSHEFAEMVTDPHTDAWFSGSVTGENGDLCNGSQGSITVAGRTWTVQKTYSKLDDVTSKGVTTCLDTKANALPALVPAFGHRITESRPFWVGDFNGDRRLDVLFYSPGDDNWWLGASNGGLLLWQFAGNTAGFGHGINDGRPFWIGRFSRSDRAQVLFYFPGDDNWWLGSDDSGNGPLNWTLAGNTAGFGHGINDGRPFWVGDFNGDGKDDMLFYFPGDDNWWLGSYASAASTSLSWTSAGNTAGFGHAINDGRPFWIGRFSRSDRAQVLFYFPGDDNWWLGSDDSGSGPLNWTLAGNTAGFGHAINDGRPFWVGDFNGDGKDDMVFYFPGDDNWWLGSYTGATATSLSWTFAGNTAGFGHAINDGRPFWIGRFSRADRAQVLFYFPGDDNWWIGSNDSGSGPLNWTLAGNTAGFGHAINDGRPFWVGDVDGDGLDEIMFYFPGDDNWWIGAHNGSQLVWGWASNTGGIPAS